jgi:hypothetical protein
MKYDNTNYNILQHHANGNVTLSAASKNLYIGYSSTHTKEVHFGNSDTNPWVSMTSSAMTINKPLFINNGANKIDIANRGDTWCHIYNTNPVPFIFNN